jgi:hypothetical protein
VSRLRKAAFAGIALLGGLGLALLGVELGVREVDPLIRVQRVRTSEGVAFHGDGGDLYWRLTRPQQDRVLDGCPAGAAGPRVLVQGSSILYGSRVAPEEAPGPGLRAALAARGVDEPCVVNFSLPASSYATQRALLADQPETAARVLLWELWQNSRNTFVRTGDVAWNFGPLELGPHGVPDPFGLGAAAPWLLARSQAYTWISLTRAPRRARGVPVQEIWAEFAPTFVDGALAEAERRGARLVVASFPGLSEPFSEQLDANARAYGPVLSLLRERGVPVVEMDRALIGQDPVALRADPCCHYNPDGVQVVSGILADAIVPMLAPEPNAGPTAAAPD